MNPVDSKGDIWVLELLDQAAQILLKEQIRKISHLNTKCFEIVLDFFLHSLTHPFTFISGKFATKQVSNKYI